MVTPFEVVAAGCVIVFPVPVAESDTGTPPNGLLLPSSTVTVIVVELPAVNVVGDASTVESDAETEGTGFTVTEAV